MSVDVSSEVSPSSDRLSVVLTESAVVEARRLRVELASECAMLRVAVRPGGCSGFSYEMFFDEDVAVDDVVSEQGGLTVVVDAVSLPLLAGSTLDYRSGLLESGFKLSNPNASRSCGCGQSFS
jgi:iron-sulfur cluster insertion protein